METWKGAVVWARHLAWGDRVFLALQVFMALWIAWMSVHLPHSGWAVAILAVVAAAMSVHGDMRGWQKAIWMILIGGLLVVELRSLSRDRADSVQSALAERQAQDEKFRKVLEHEDNDFRATAKSLSDAYTLSRSQFAATITKESDVLQKTGQAADAAREGVANLTGGRAYVAVIPSFYFDGRPDSENIIRLMVMAKGGHTVWDATLNASEDLPATNARVPYIEKHLADIPLGAVSSTYIRPLGLDLRPSRDSVTVYGFSVFARNNPTSEALYVRFNHSENRWQFKTLLTRIAIAPRFENETLEDTGWVH